MGDSGVLRKITSMLYPTLPPELKWPEPKGGKELPEGGNKMAVEYDNWPRVSDDKSGKTLSKYCEIPAQGIPVEISGKQVSLYKTVLESLGYSTNLEKFTVDSRGDSPELREELGKGYLDNRVILVSESQLRKPSLLAGNQSYMHRIISDIQAELVKKITPHEALTGKVNILYGHAPITGVFDTDFKESSSTVGLHAMLSLDTLTESVKKINFLNNKISFITENSLKNLEKELLNSILTEIHPLTTKYSNIESIKNSNIISVPLEEEILYFEHKGRDIFFFKNQTPNVFLVYNGSKVEHTKLPFEILHSSEKSRIMDYLVKNSFLKVEKENIFKNLESMAKSFLGEQVQHCSEMTGFHFYKIFKKFKDHPEISGKLKETDWYLLRDVCYGNIEFSTLPLVLKEGITSPKDESVGSYMKLLNEKALKNG